MLVSCPECKEEVHPKPVGNVEDDGEYEYMYSECPTCEHIFTADDYQEQ